MRNQNTEAAWEYHNKTKHSPVSVYSNPHFLDWENQPVPFKIYTALEPVPLPVSPSDNRSVPPVDSGGALSVISANAAETDAVPVPNLETLSYLLYFSAGITRRKVYQGGGGYLFRAAACTGALYHIDLYLVCGNLSDLEAGVYHFGPHDFSLTKLRDGDYRSVLAKASAQEPSIMKAPVIVVCTSTFWRNAWKYQARTYRHCFWDNGTILANLLAAASAKKLPAKIVLGFQDSPVAQLLDLDTGREVALSLVPLGKALPMTPPPLPALPALQLKTNRLSKSEVDYPAIRAMHLASCLETEKEASDWRENKSPGFQKTEPAGKTFPLMLPEKHELPEDTIEEVIIRRGSTRQFARVPITLEQLSTMLDAATHKIPADFPPMNDLYLIVNDVKDLPSGAYFFSRKEKKYELLKEGNFRREAGFLGLEQEIPADASVDVFFLTSLHSVLERFGNRGYRAAQLEAAVMGGKLYLAAYAQRLGASGLTFFDDEATHFFSPHAKDKSVMFLIALGKSVKRRS